MTRSIIPLAALLLLSLAALPACKERRVMATTSGQDSTPASGQAQPATPSVQQDGQPSASESGSPADAASPTQAESPAAQESPSAPAANATPLPSPVVPDSYDYEQDWNDAQHLIPLNYQQAQGKRVFYTNCVWCHADATPAGPSNRSNVTPAPPLINDGQTFNQLGDDFLQNTITLGGSAMGKSAMMPPWGQTLSQNDIRAVIAFIRAVAVPQYQPSAQPKSQYSVK